jgi:hypothetical protein
MNFHFMDCFFFLPYFSTPEHTIRSVLLPGKSCLLYLSQYRTWRDREKLGKEGKNTNEFKEDEIRKPLLQNDNALKFLNSSKYSVAQLKMTSHDESSHIPALTSLSKGPLQWG